MAVPTTMSRPGNLPAELTSFVGRRSELAELKRLLTTSRLLTLVGPGGGGKTRLALRAARDVARAYPEGVWLVSLAAIEDPQLLPQAVFGAMGLQDRSTGWALSTLMEYLAGKRLLLVLDNCEHLLDSCAVLSGSLLKSCPQLRLLATSRQPLGIAGEVRMRVPPLSLPEGVTPVAATRLLNFDAVALLADRAMAILPNFRVDENNAAAVLGLCRRLDGIPLALELAAGRLEALSVEQLNRALDGELSTLGVGNRGAEPRQQTLESTMAWSYRLLDEPERRLWARMSVFAGGFDQEAAVQVCSSPDLPGERIVELLATLVEKSILRRDPIGGTERYEQLETLRQFGRQRLREMGEEARLQGLHRDWILELAVAAGASDHRQADMFERIYRERDNLWAAVDFCLRRPGEAVKGVEICRHLHIYWVSRGPLGDARRVVASLLALTEPESVARAHCLWLGALLAIGQHDYQDCELKAAESLRIGRQHGSSEVVAWSLFYMGFAAAAELRTAEAVALCESALALGTAMDSRPMMLSALLGLCVSRALGGDFEAIVEPAERALALSLESGESWNRGYLLNFLSQAWWHRGDAPRAEALAKEGINCHNALDNRVGLAMLVDTLASMAADSGPAERAATLLGGAQHLRELAGFPIFTPYRSQHEQSESSARERLRDAAFAAAFERGRAMSTDAVVAFALDQKPPSKAARPTAPKAAIPLTRRELEIAKLIADGLTTRDVAAKLSISDRTVETHVTNMLNKLGFNSRIQLAGWVANLGN